MFLETMHSEDITLTIRFVSSSVRGDISFPSSLCLSMLISYSDSSCTTEHIQIEQLSADGDDLPVLRRTHMVVVLPAPLWPRNEVICPS